MNCRQNIFLVQSNSSKSAKLIEAEHLMGVISENCNELAIYDVTIADCARECIVRKEHGATEILYRDTEMIVSSVFAS